MFIRTVNRSGCLYTRRENHHLRLHRCRFRPRWRPTCRPSGNRWILCASSRGWRRSRRRPHCRNPALANRVIGIYCSILAVLCRPLPKLYPGSTRFEVHLEDTRRLVPCWSQSSTRKHTVGNILSKGGNAWWMRGAQRLGCHISPRQRLELCRSNYGGRIMVSRQDATILGRF